MKRVFVDTNVILDVVLQRDGFWGDSLKVFQFEEQGKIKACVSASSITDVFYISRKKLSIPTARQVIEDLLSIFEVVGVDGKDLTGALSVPIDDYEDALQAYCASKVSADVLVTKDMEGFPGIGIEVVDPANFTLQ